MAKQKNLKVFFIPTNKIDRRLSEVFYTTEKKTLNTYFVLFSLCFSQVAKKNIQNFISVRSKSTDVFISPQILLPI